MKEFKSEKRTIEEVRKTMIDKINSLSPDELEELWNHGFGSKGNYLWFSNQDQIFHTQEQDWSDPCWDIRDD